MRVFVLATVLCSLGAAPAAAEEVPIELGAEGVPGATAPCNATKAQVRPRPLRPAPKPAPPPEPEPEPEPPLTCPTGQWVAESTGEHCCWLGQDWDLETGACAGPPICPDGTLTLDDSCADPPRMVWVDPGPIVVGSQRPEPGRHADERRLAVEVGQPFLVTEHEVTQALYVAIMGDNPAERCAETLAGEDHPVVCTSWNDAVVFANALSERQGLQPAYALQAGEVRWDRGADGYRLPTEAEWELAARAGDPTRFPGADHVELVGWGRDNAGRPQTVGGLRPNALGIFDLAGNASEWVWDGFASPLFRPRPAVTDAGPIRIHKGGSWADGAERMRIAARHREYAGQVSPAIGVRLARNAGTSGS